MGTETTQQHNSHLQHKSLYCTTAAWSSMDLTEAKRQDLPFSTDPFAELSTLNPQITPQMTGYGSYYVQEAITCVLALMWVAALLVTNSTHVQLPGNLYVNYPV